MRGFLGLYLVYFAATGLLDRQGLAQEPEERQARVQATTVVGDKGLGIARAEIALGNFLPGTEILSSLTVRNAGERTLRFDEIEAGCSCLSVSPKKGGIAPGESLVFYAKVRSTLNPSRLNQTATFTAKLQNVPVLSVRLEYNVVGVVGFGSESAQVVVPRGSGVYETSVAVFADPSVSEDTVEVKPSSSLSDLHFGLDLGEGKLFFSVPEDIVLDGDLFGEVRLENVETGFTDSIPISIRLDHAITIFPRRLRFRLADDHAGELRAEAPVMILDKNRDAAERLATSLTLECKGQAFQVSRKTTQGQLTHCVISVPLEIFAGSRNSTLRANGTAIGKHSTRAFSIHCVLESDYPTIRKVEND